MNLNLLFDSLVTVQIKLRVVVVVETLAWFLSQTSSKRRYRKEERGMIRPKRIYFPEHFCYCFSSNLCVLNTTNMD
jgi:hypothetical protein